VAVPAIEQILVYIADSSLKDALIYLAAYNIVDYSKKGFEKVKQKIFEKAEETKYQFVPDRKQALILKELGNHPDYITFVELLPDYRYHDTIRTGLLIRSYMMNPTKGNKEQNKIIKTQIAKKPNAKKLLNLVRLASTPYFSVVIDNIYRLKRDGYTNTQLAEEFDEIINEWDNSYLPVKSVNSIKQIKDYCSKQVNSKSKQFFLLGIETAAIKLEKAIAELTKVKFFKNKGYKITITKNDQAAKIEVTVRRISELDTALIKD